MEQDIKETPSPFIYNYNYKLEVIHEFVYLGSTITDNLSIDSAPNKQIGKAATILSRLTKCVWSNNRLTEHTKVNVYKACGNQYFALWKLALDYVCTPRENVECVSHVLPQMYPGNHMAEQGAK